MTLTGTENGVLKDCLLVGVQSRNGRKYPVKVLEESRALYEDRKIFVDHCYDDSKRTIRERWGVAKNVHVDETGLRGDVHYLESHAATPSILETIQRFNDIGFSHDADLATDSSGVVTQIARVYSIDIVNDPATTKNVREEHTEMKKATLGAILRANVKVAPVARMLARVTEMEGDAIMLDGEVPEVEESAIVGDDAISAAFKSAISAILDQDGTVADKIAKIQSLLNAQAEVTGEGGGDSSTPPDDSAKEELANVRSELDTTKRELEEVKAELSTVKGHGECRRMLESANREVTDVRVRALSLLTDAKDRESLVSSWPEKVAKPNKSPSKVREGYDDKGEIPGDVEGLKRLLGVGGKR